MKITEDDAAVIKGMLARDDKQQWVVAWFGGDINPGHWRRSTPSNGSRMSTRRRARGFRR
jgi:hypothetical protein